MGIKFYVEGGSKLAINLGMNGFLQDFAYCRKNRDGPVVIGVTPVTRLMQGDDFSRLPSTGKCR